MITEFVNISCLGSEAAWTFIKIIERLGWCFDWDDETTMAVNVPVEDEHMFDFLITGFN